MRKWPVDCGPRDMAMNWEKADFTLCFCLLHGTSQIGFARAVTDRTVFTWIADLVIDAVPPS